MISTDTSTRLFAVFCMMFCACSADSDSQISSATSPDRFFENSNEGFVSELGLKSGMLRAQVEPIIYKTLLPKSYQARQHFTSRFEELGDGRYLLIAYSGNISDQNVKFREIAAEFEVNDDGYDILVRAATRHVCVEDAYSELGNKKC